MDGIKTLVIILILLIILIVTLQSKAKKKHIKSRTKKKYANDETSKDTLSTPEPVGEDIDVKQAYTPKWLFSMNEKRAYYKLNDIAKKHNLVVFAKVRLLDLVTPQRNNPKEKWRGLLYQGGGGGGGGGGLVFWCVWGWGYFKGSVLYNL